MPRSDLRLPMLGAAAWAGGLVGAIGSRMPAVTVLAGLAVALAVAAAWRFPHARATLVASVVVMLAVACGAMVRHAQARASPLADLAARRAVVGLVGTITSDPRLVSGTYGDQTLVRLRVRSVTAGGMLTRLRADVLVRGTPSWGRVQLGQTVRLTGRLAPAIDPGLSASVTPRSGPAQVAPPGPAWRAAGKLRAAIKESVSRAPPEPRALVPALIDGDQSQVPPGLADDFRVTGLTHLMAVSGTNLTLLVGFLLTSARWCRVRGRWLGVVAVGGIAGFILLARTEPSVLRAAAMGTVGVLAMGSNGRGRALRGLGAAVVGLLLVDPALATSIGFALSTLATAGILLVGPTWRDALARWLPRWLAEAIAVPTAAQLACTPLIAAISGQVSLAAIGANLVAEPVVGPATILGLAAGLLGVVWAPLGRVPGTVASWLVGWIITVADHGAHLPKAAIGWGTGLVGLTVLTVLTGAIALYGPRLVRHPAVGILTCLVMIVLVGVRLPVRGWPPAGWVFVACDVGQGDAMVLSAAPGEAVVVDAGPDPALVARCLDELGVRAVPLVVLTHFHADHVDGIAGVLQGRRVSEIETTRLQDPPPGVRLVAEAAARAHVPVRPVDYAMTRRIGDLTLQVLWPLPSSPTLGPGDGSTANEASVVLLVESRGLRLLLTGDVQPEGQAAIGRMLPGLHVDVLKMPHHGSRYQDLPWLQSLQPRITVTSVGAHNTYGHPAASTLQPFQRAGVPTYRTDRDGAVAVLAGDRVATR